MLSSVLKYKLMSLHREIKKEKLPKSVAKSAKPCIALFSIRANQNKYINK